MTHNDLPFEITIKGRRQSFLIQMPVRGGGSSKKGEGRGTPHSILSNYIHAKYILDADRTLDLSNQVYRSKSVSFVNAAFSFRRCPALSYYADAVQLHRYFGFPGNPAKGTNMT